MSQSGHTVHNIMLKSVLFAAGLWLALQAARPSVGLCQNVVPQAFPRFPDQTDSAAIAAWLEQSTSVKPADVVLVGDGAVLAIEQGREETTAAGTKFIRLREELTSAKLIERLGGRSSTVSASFDCAASQYKLADPLVFKGSNLLGGPGQFMEPGDWIRASPNWTFELPKVFCGSGHPRPFAAISGSQASPEHQQQSKAPTVAPDASLSPHWVQAGAFPSIGLAEAEWDKVKDALPDAKTNHRTEAVTKPIGLYRLLIGPYDSKTTASLACEALKRSNVACFVR